MSLRSRFVAAVLAAGVCLSLVAGCGNAATPDDGASPQPQVTGSSAPTGEQSEGTGQAEGAGTEAADPSDEPATDDAAPSESGVISGSSADDPASTTNPAPTFPLTVDASNGSVTMDAKPVAIASLSPSTTEILYAIGAGDQVTVVDKNADYPEGKLPDVAIDGYQLNIESLASHKPDLVITSGGDPKQLAKMGEIGLTVLVEPAPATLEDVYGQITQLGAVTGHVDGAAALVTKMKDQVADIVASVPETDAPLTYYYEVSPTYYSVTSATFIGHVLALLGLESIADKAEGGSASGYPQLSAEYILASDPDFIFLADTECCGESPATVAERPGWDALAAVQGDHVVGLDDDIATRWGPRIVTLMKTVLAAIEEHPATP